MEDALLHSFITLVERKIGCDVRAEDLGSFRETILMRARALSLPGAEAYYQLLRTANPRARSEWRQLAALLTTGESFFFRDQAQFALLRERILPELSSRQPAGSLRLWSAGCATGEEPYSIAMLLDVLYPARQTREPCILGTDINEEALEKARKGIYRAWSFRTMDPELRRRYFHKRGEEWELNARIRSQVRFLPLNLLEDPFPDPASGLCEMDIIVCRNVFIYFSQQAITRVIDKCAATLRDGGYLLTGHGELHGVAVLRFRPRIFGELVVYQKTGQAAGEASPAPQRTGAVPPQSIASGARVTRPLRPAPKLVTDQGPAAVARPVQALVPEKTGDPESLLLTARACADAGRYADAAGVCREVLALDPTASASYFLLAQLAEAQGDYEAAKDLLRKAVYLAPDFVAAYLELAALYEREHNLPRATKLRSTACELLQALPPQTAIRPYQDMTAGELLAHLVRSP